MATLKSSAKKSPEVTAPQGLSRGEREAAKRARKLRRQTSEDEQKLWHQLRDKQLDGFRFKRQRSIGKYIVDFVSDEAKLIIELRDQMPDSNPIEKARAAYFKAQGYLVLHMLNNEVTASIKTGLEAIRKHLRGEDVAPDVVPEETVKSKKAAAPKVAKKLAADREPESAVEMTAKAALPAKKVAAKKTVAKKVVAKTAATESEAVESTIKTKSVVKTATTKKPAAKKPAVKKLAAKNKAEESGA